MLHYSNASSIGENRRYLVIKGGLPGCSGKEGVVVDVVDHRGSIGLGVYRREEGEETVNKANIASQSITWQYDVPGVT